MSERKRSPAGQTPAERMAFIGWTMTENGCHVWNGGISSTGYGHISINRRTRYAHRISLELKLGRPIRPGMLACHTCDNRPCVNPDHLYEGTYKDNSSDTISRGRWNRVGAKRGGERGGRAHTYTPEVIELVLSMRASGAPVREIHRATALSKSYIHALLSGRRPKYVPNPENQEQVIE